MAFGRWGNRGTGTATGTGNSVSNALAPSLWTVLLLAFASWIVLLAGELYLEEAPRRGHACTSIVSTPLGGLAARLAGSCRGCCCCGAG